MKKVILAIVIFIAVIGGLVLTNQTNDRAEFNKELAEFSAICKKESYEWGEIKSIEFKDSVLTIITTFNNDYISTEAGDFLSKIYESNPQQFSQTSTYFLSSMFVKILEDKKTEKFYDHLKKYVSVINFKYELSTGEVLSINSNMADIAELTDKFRDNPDEAIRCALNQRINMEKTYLPLRIDEITMAVDEYLNGDTLVYVYEIDENQVSFSDIKYYVEDNSAFTQSLLNEPIVRNNMMQFNVDITYRYVGSKSGKSFDVILRKSDLY